MSFDVQGTIVSVIQVVALILLIVGVYPAKIRTKTRNLIIHGFLSILAFALNLGTVVSVMIPTFTSSLADISVLPILQSTIVWLHVALGIAAVVLGFAIIFSWIIHPLGELGCAKMWRLMLPTFLIWALSLVLGLILHFNNIV